ncbi:chemotaxis protein CheA [Paracoccus sp. NSM]|uniref:chemotaxis protein CheA n=1 Tax=Paracoccus sp. NSM TaxID=3457784 RepID=UPI004035048A
MTDELTAAFLEELGDLVESLERGLLDLKADPDQPERVNQVFRDLHTIKGSGAMFGFTALAGFIHDFETAFDRVRSGKAPVTPELIRLALAARDQIPALVENLPDPEDARGAILRTLNALTGGGPAPAATAAAAAAATGTTRPEAGTPTRLTFRLTGPALSLGARPDLILQELRDLGATEVAAHLDDLPPPENLDPDQSYLSWSMALPPRTRREDLDEVFLFVDADWQWQAETPAEAPPAPAATAPVQPDRPAPPQPAPAIGAEAAASVRVPAARLDTLMDAVGELVTVEARLTEIARASRDSSLIATAELITRLAGQLRDATIVMRMVPMRSLIGRFRRLIDGLSETLGKPVDFVVLGEETELDKTMIEKLADPLVHILRNAIDHGMEPPAERAASGKGATGRIELAAIHAGGEVLIRVRDDGRGMDAERIRAKAVERGLLAPDAHVSESQIFAMIFEPGFSTADTVTELSGRGVGMDVVRRTIENLRGSIDVESSLGSGTTVTLRLPLTLAIIDGLLIEVGGERYTVPLASVKEIVELPRSKVQPSRTQDFLDIRGRFVPFLRLGALFACDAPPAETQNVVIVEAADGVVGLVVDRIIGTNQTVIKQMSKLHRSARSISGATIVGDGSVALIIDVPQLVALAGSDAYRGSEAAA